MEKDDEIRLIAYSIWEEEGCINGRDCEHWFKAETIWEQQKKPDTDSKSAKGEPKQDVGQGPKVMAAKKKSPKTKS